MNTLFSRSMATVLAVAVLNAGGTYAADADSDKLALAQRSPATAAGTSVRPVDPPLGPLCQCPPTAPRSYTAPVGNGFTSNFDRAALHLAQLES